MTSDVKSFACDYYSDGTNICYNGFRDVTLSDEKNSKRLQGFSIVGEGEAVNGSWTVNDGKRNRPILIHALRHCFSRIQVIA